MRVRIGTRPASAVLACALVLAACASPATGARPSAATPAPASSSTGPSSTGPSSTGRPATGPSSSATTVSGGSDTAPDTGDVSGFEVATVTVVAPDGASRSLLVAVADTAERRRRGLMGVRDLGALDGMLFVSEGPTTTGFWMRDTLLPLDVAFFGPDAEGGDPVLLGTITMTPCTASPCPTYAPPGPWTHALETPEGDLVLEPGTRLVLGP